jgi:Family of unknown function (DUF6252)
MKNLIGKPYLTFCILALMLSIQCRKSNSLPPETQVGNNTFGCLVNGQIFTLKGQGISPFYQCYYQQIYPGPAGYIFNVSGDMKGSNCETKFIVIAADSLTLIEGNYKLGESIKGKFAAGYDYYQNCNAAISEYYTTAIDTGMLVIKKFDEINHIVSGTFWFNAANSSGQKIQVREGRFDMRYTQ